MWALGDILVATPLLTALKKQFSGCEISWLVDKDYVGAVADNPLIDDIVSIDWRSWQKDFRYGNLLSYILTGLRISQDLKRRKFDIVISLTPDKWWCLWFNCAPVRLALFPSNKPGFLAKFYTHFLLRQPGSTDHHVDRNLSVLQLLGIDGPYDRRLVFGIAENNRGAAQQFLADQPDSASIGRYVVFHPGTSQKTKCWSTDYFAALADLAAPDLRVIITGSKSDRVLAEEIKSQANTKQSIVIAAGELANMGQTAALIQGASAVVTGDTSILHIASALNIPTVAVYGSTRPNEYVPLFGSNALLYDDTVTCAPCYKSSCALVGKEHLSCLRKITPPVVYERLISLILAKT
jgi:ADP-heptose:LPS heptosyltransferase